MPYELLHLLIDDCSHTVMQSLNVELLVRPPLLVTGQQLNTLLLKFVEEDVLTVTLYTHVPLLQLSQDALFVLNCDASVITLGARVLHADHVAVLGPRLL